MKNREPQKNEPSFSSSKNPFSKRLDDLKFVESTDTKVKNLEYGILANTTMASTSKAKYNTKLLTHRLSASEFMTRLNYEVTRGARYKRPVSLLMISLDGIDNLIDNWGEETCSALLESVYEKICSIVREIDLSGVYQSSILSFILPETNKNGANIVANRISKSMLNAQFNYQFHTFTLSVSQGIACVPDNGLTTQEILESAFQALQTANQTYGGNQVVIANSQNI